MNNFPSTDCLNPCTKHISVNRTTLFPHPFILAIPRWCFCNKWLLNWLLQETFPKWHKGIINFAYNIFAWNCYWWRKLTCRLLLWSKTIYGSCLVHEDEGTKWILLTLNLFIAVLSFCGDVRLEGLLQVNRQNANVLSLIPYHKYISANYFKIADRSRELTV